jgi:hypothetical protein
VCFTPSFLNFVSPRLPSFPERMFIHTTAPFRTRETELPWNSIPRVTSRPNQQPFVQVQRTEPRHSVCSVPRHHHELFIATINRLQVLHQVKSRAVDTSSGIHILKHRHRFVVCPSRVGRLSLLTDCSDTGLSFRLQFQLDTSFLVKASVCSGNIQPVQHGYVAQPVDTYPIWIRITYAVDTYPRSIRKKTNMNKLEVGIGPPYPTTGYVWAQQGGDGGGSTSWGICRCGRG